MSGPPPATLGADEVDAVRRRVLNVVGHELRTPMSALAGLARRLAEASDEEIRREVGPAIERLATRTERLVDDLLVASGIETAIPVDRPVAVDLAALVTEAWEGLGPLTTRRSLQLHGGAIARVGTDTARRIMGHLLRNAATYGRGDVEVWVDEHDEVTRAEVVSHGSVPTAHERRLVFEAFYRGEHAVTDGPGLGLGLTVARALARHVGGEVEFSAHDDGRAVTTVTLPAAGASHG